MFLFLESLKSSSISSIIKSIFIIIRFFCWFLIILPSFVGITNSVSFDQLFILLRITEVVFSYTFNDFLYRLFINFRIFTEFILQCSFWYVPLCYYCNNKWRLILMKITLTFLDTSFSIVTWFFVIFSPLDLLYHHEVPWEVSMFSLFYLSFSRFFNRLKFANFLESD